MIFWQTCDRLALTGEELSRVDVFEAMTHTLVSNLTGQEIMLDGLLELADGAHGLIEMLRLFFRVLCFICCHRKKLPSSGFGRNLLKLPVFLKFF